MICILVRFKKQLLRSCECTGQVLDLAAAGKRSKVRSLRLVKGWSDMNDSPTHKDIWSASVTESNLVIQKKWHGRPQTAHRMPGYRTTGLVGEAGISCPHQANSLYLALGKTYTHKIAWELCLEVSFTSFIELHKYFHKALCHYNIIFLLNIF